MEGSVESGDFLNVGPKAISPVGVATFFGRSLGRICDSKSSGKTFEDAAESSGCGHGGGAWRGRVVNDGALLEHFSFFSKSTLRFLRVMLHQQRQNALRPPS